MTIVKVQGVKTGTNTVTLDATPTRGNYLIACLGGDTGGSVTALTQAGVSWKPAVVNDDVLSEYSMPISSEIWIGKVGVNAGKTVTVTSSAIAFSIMVAEYSGLAGTVDRTAHNVSGDSYDPILTGTTDPTSSPSELWVGCLTCDDGDGDSFSGAASNGFTMVTTTYGEAAFLQKIVSAVGTAYSSAVGTIGGAGCIATFPEEAPLYARVVLTDEWGLDHTITPTGQGTVLSLVLNYLNQAKAFMFTLQDFDAAFMNWIKKGCIARFYCDTVYPPNTLRLVAMVEGIERTQNSMSSLRLKVTGREHAYIKTIERIVTEAYLNQKPSDIVRSLLSIYYPYPDDTVLAMSFYEGTGTVAHDESRYGNNGTITGASSANGKFGEALNFNGTTHRVVVPDSVSLNSIANGLSIFMWIKPADITLECSLVRKGQHSWEFFQEYDGLETYLKTANKEGGLIYYGHGNLVNGVWAFIGYTLDSVTGILTLYINGAAVASATGYTGAIYSSVGTDLWLGLRGSVGVLPFKGVMDEVRLWNRALSAQEVLDIYTHGYLHNISPSIDTAIQDIRFNYKYLKDCFDVLARLSASKYWWTPTEVLNFLVDSTTDSAIDYDNSDISSQPDSLQSLIPIKNRVYVIGGLQKLVDQQQTTVA